VLSPTKVGDKEVEGLRTPVESPFKGASPYTKKYGTSTRNSSRRSSFASIGSRAANYIPRALEVSHWKPDSETCNICNSKFGWFLGRHRCSLCGACACAYCPSRNIPAASSFGK